MVCSRRRPAVGRADEAAAEREWRRALDDHAHAMVATAIGGALSHAYFAQTLRLSPEMGGRSTIEVRGPGGEWRRYYVRLTEVAK